jgi:prepilin-type N-terminal cleavage/methylation domain-containing protein
MSKSGFTLIETLIAISLIGFLTGFGTITAKEQIDKGYDARRKGDINNLKGTLENFYNDHDCYPTKDLWDALECGSTSNFLSNYTKSIPCDPTDKTLYYYERTDNLGNSCSGSCLQCPGYRLMAVLSRPNDPDIAAVGCTQSGCGVTTANNRIPNWGISTGGSVSVPAFSSSSGAASCKSEGSECLINSSDKICCTGLTCVLNNSYSGNGKCEGASSPTPEISETISPSITLFITPTPTITNCSANPFSPPTVSIKASSDVVTTGTPFTINVSASSCVGLASVWWYGAGGPDVDVTLSLSFPQTPTSSQMFTTPFSNPTKLTRAYGSPYFTAAQTVHNYSFTSTLIIPTTGSYIFGANSRDVLYPIPGQPHQASEGMGLQFVKIQVK